MTAHAGAHMSSVSMKRAGDPSYADHSKPSHPSYCIGSDRDGDPAIDGLEHPGVKEDPGGKWISKAIKKPGSLHRQLGVPEGEKIPAKKMAAARSGKKGPLAAKRANLAKTLSKF